MRFNVFRRSDGALVVVPALFQSPLAVAAEGELRRLGSAYVDLETLSEPLVEHIGLNGYAIARGVDEALLRSATERDSTPERVVLSRRTRSAPATRVA